MRACNRNILRRVHVIIRSQILKSLEDAISNCSVSGLGIEDKINESVIRVVYISNDESTGVNSLTESSSNLTQASIAL